MFSRESKVKDIDIQKQLDEIGREHQKQIEELEQKQESEIAELKRKHKHEIEEVQGTNLRVFFTIVLHTIFACLSLTVPDSFS